MYECDVIVMIFLNLLTIYLAQFFSDLFLTILAFNKINGKLVNILLLFLNS